MIRNQNPTPKKEDKTCYFCAQNMQLIDYKNIIMLRRFINTAGKIIPTRRTGTCAKHQRALSKAIKRSRILGLLPFVAR